MLSWTEYQKRIETESFIVIQLDRMGCQVIRKNREYVEALIEVVLYCAQQGIEANGILSGITAFNFVICLVTYNNVFHVTAKLSDKLQAESLDLGSELVSFYHG